MNPISPTTKFRCDVWRCGWVGPFSEVLKSPNPFVTGGELFACPVCKTLEIGLACDEPGCKLAVCCGFPTPTGYRQTCHTHSELYTAP